MTHSRTIAALLTVPLLSLAACGGGGDSDNDKISKIIKDVAKDPASLCGHLEATTLKALGGKAGCEKTAKASDTGDDRKADIDSIDVNGEKATAKITTKQGKQTIQFVKKDGDWLVTTG